MRPGFWHHLQSVCSWIFLQPPHFEGPNDHPEPNQRRDMRKGLCRVYNSLCIYTDPIPGGHGWLISGITAIFKHDIVVIESIIFSEWFFDVLPQTYGA